MTHDAKEAGDATLVRLKPTPPSLDYTCSCCGKHLTAKDYTTKITDETKLLITAKHCGQSADFLIYLGFGGTLFEAAPRQWKRPLDDLP